MMSTCANCWPRRMSTPGSPSMGQSKVARATKGSRPGCSLADIIFNLAFAPALSEVAAALRDGGHLWTVPAAPPCFAQPPGADGLDARTVQGEGSSAYADDVAFCCVLDNGNLQQDVATVCGKVWRVLASRGMLLNLAQGKTGAMVVPRGAGARELKQQLWCNTDASIDVPGAGRFFLDKCYKHLGSLVASDGNLVAEVGARKRAHCQALGP